MPQRRMPELVPVGSPLEGRRGSANLYSSARVLFRSLPRRRRPASSACSEGGVSMQGHIRKQSKGSWELKFDLGRDPLSGKRVTKYVTFRGPKRKAQDELTRLLAHRDDGSYVDPTKMTVA